MTDLYENKYYNKVVYIIDETNDEFKIIEARVSSEFEHGHYVARPTEISAARYWFKDEHINESVFFSIEEAEKALEILCKMRIEKTE